MKNRKSQVALITVMILATILTLVLSASFRTIVDTQTSKLEEENQKALAAAEAAVEASIKENGTTTVGQGSLENISGISGGATVTSLADHTFTSNRVEKNNQYTFYLANYNPDTKTLGTSSLAQTVTICFQSATTNPALEITLLKVASIKRYVVDPSARITNAALPSSICPDSTYAYSYDIPSADISTDSQLIIVKAVFNGTKLYFSRSSNFELQGKAATGEVTSDAGVSKKVYLFQSYPQIPSDFFDTSF